MKKAISLALALCLLVSALAGCGGGEDRELELVVFAAASMTETLEEIAELYREAAPNVSLSFNLDSSGTLKTQIEEGAACDVFISAGQKQMDQLDVEAGGEVNADGLDFVMEGTRINLLENKVVLCVPPNNPLDIQGFEDMIDKIMEEDFLLAMGNEDVPVGQYTRKILMYFAIMEDVMAEMGKITYGSNVKEVTTQIFEGSVSCGVVYSTDAFSAGLQVVEEADAKMCGQVIYPAAVMKDSENADAAKAFLDYLQSAEAMEVFKSVGFSAA